MMRAMATKKKRAAEAPYHHGSLETELAEAGVALVREVGHPAVSIRELARRTGVSHTAAHYHFKTRQALLGAIAAKGFERTAKALEEAARSEPDARLRLRRVGAAYVEYALREPEMYRLMFSSETADRSIHPELEKNAAALLQLLSTTLGEKRGGRRKSTAGPDLALAAWSLVHGLASLLLDGQVTRSVSAGRKIEELIDGVLEHVEFKE